MSRCAFLVLDEKEEVAGKKNNNNAASLFRQVQNGSALFGTLATLKYFTSEHCQALFRSVPSPGDWSVLCSSSFPYLFRILLLSSWCLCLCVSACCVTVSAAHSYLYRFFKSLPACRQADVLLICLCFRFRFVFFPHSLPYVSHHSRCGCTIVLLQRKKRFIMKD